MCMVILNDSRDFQCSKRLKLFDTRENNMTFKKTNKKPNQPFQEEIRQNKTKNMPLGFLKRWYLVCNLFSQVEFLWSSLRD